VRFKLDQLMPKVKVNVMAVAVAVLGCLICPLLSARPSTRPPVHTSPYSWQISKQRALLRSPSAQVRAGAAEALGFLRAYTAADALAQALIDDSPEVRRQAAMSLAWCGVRKQIPALLEALADRDWVVRQGAWAALTNLTGMEFEFDALAEAEMRKKQINRWQQWWMQWSLDGQRQQRQWRELGRIS